MRQAPQVIAVLVACIILMVSILTVSGGLLNSATRKRNGKFITDYIRVNELNVEGNETMPSSKSAQANRAEAEAIAAILEAEALALAAEQATAVNESMTQAERDATKSYVTDCPLNTERGALYYNGHKETYYSQNVLPGEALNIPGRHVCETDGTIRDWDGYICVAADYSFAPYGEVVETSLGYAKVYDTGCAYGTIDLYVDW